MVSKSETGSTYLEKNFMSMYIREIFPFKNTLL